MLLESFGTFLQHCPLLFRELLQRQSKSVSPELMQGVLSFYQLLTVADCRTFRERKALPRHRVIRLANQAGLDLTEALLPLTLYDSYVAIARRSNREPSSVTEEEIRFWLTGGSIPLDN